MVDYLELHGAELVEDLAHVLADDAPGDPVVALSGRLHSMARHFIKRNHVREDAHRLVEWAESRGKETTIRYLDSGRQANRQIVALHDKQQTLKRTSN